MRSLLGVANIFAAACLCAFAAKAQTCSPCENLVWVASDAAWDCRPKAAGTACDDGNVCTISDHCDGAGSCVGGNAPSTTACNDGVACTTSDHCNGSGSCVGVPGATGAISGPTNSTTGSYTLSWTAACGATQYTLYENGVGIFTGNSQALSAPI